MKKKKKLLWQQITGITFLLVLGMICGFALNNNLDKFTPDTPLHHRLLIFAGQLLCMYIALLFHMIIHETGHLIFGLISGYKFSSFRIASFMLVKDNGKLRLKRFSISGTGGQCLMTPPDLKDGKIPFVLYNLGGSVFNVIISTLFLGIYFLCADIPYLSSILLIFTAIGFVSAMTNGIPMRLGTVDNDGYNTVALSGNKAAVEAFWVQLKVVEQSSKGVCIKDMPAEWFTVPSDEELKNSMIAVRGVFACNRLMEQKRFEDADKLMSHILEIESGMVGLHRSLMICDRIFVELTGKNRLEVIQNMLTKEQNKFMKSMKRYPTVLRTQYSIALLYENDTAKAERIKKEFDNCAKSYPYPHETDTERELMEIAESKFTSLSPAH